MANIVFHSVRSASTELQVGHQQDTGFIDGTAMCVAYGKKIGNWLKTDDTFELVASLAEDLGIEPKCSKKSNSISMRVAAAYPDLVIS